jgi:hypothetical protein
VWICVWCCISPDGLLKVLSCSSAGMRIESVPFGVLTSLVASRALSAKWCPACHGRIGCWS